MARQRRKGQNPDEWKAEVENCLAPTAMVLQNYSGDKLRIVRQIRLTLARLGFVTETLVQVQKGAPAKLLIGSDVLPQLGYLFVQSTMEGEDVDLLRNEFDSSSVMEESVSEVNPTEMDANCDHNIWPMVPEAVGTVHLIQATKLSARHRKMVKTQVAGVSYEDCKLVIFKPNACGMKEGCILMPEALTSVDINNKVVLVLENHGCEPIYLEVGKMLGWIYDATICPGWEVGGSTDVNALPDSTVAVSGGSVNMLTTASGTNSERYPKEQLLGEPLEGDSRLLRLFNALTVDESNLTAEQFSLIKSLVVEYLDVFALDVSELGSTNLVSHTINTGDSPPVRQPVRRTPFALHEKMEELIQNMMAQGVIQHSNSPWASPVVLVEKKDGSYRFCVDYQRLNAVTRMDVFSLPRVDDTLDMLS